MEWTQVSFFHERPDAEREQQSPETTKKGLGEIKVYGKKFFPMGETTVSTHFVTDYS